MSPLPIAVLTGPGMHAVDADRVLTQLGRECAGHAGDRVLAGGVVNHERLHLDTGGRTDQDDRPAPAAIDDSLCPGHHGIPGTRHVDVHDVAEVFRRDVVPHLGSGDSGVGDDDVEPTQRGDPIPDGLSESAEVTRIDHRGDDSTVGGLHQADGFGEVL
jgi:hypothetical protein